MKKVLVTGCAGFIGSNMVSFLLENTSYEIVGIDNFCGGRKNEEYIRNLAKDKRFEFFE